MRLRSPEKTCVGSISLSGAKDKAGSTLGFYFHRGRGFSNVGGTNTPVVLRDRLIEPRPNPWLRRGRPYCFRYIVIKLRISR